MIKKPLDGFVSLIVILVAALAVLLVGVRVLGFEVYTVLSGSMEPAYHVGSVICVKPTDPRELKIGDTITFLANETTVVTHRITGIIPDTDDPDTLWFRTKGDANSTEDAALVQDGKVIGRVIFSIPCLGYLSLWIQNLPGLYVALGLGAALLLLLFRPAEKKNRHSTTDRG